MLLENILFLVELVRIVQQVNIQHHRDQLDVQHARLDIIQQQEQQVVQNVKREDINQIQDKEVVYHVIHSVKHAIISMEIV